MELVTHAVDRHAAGEQPLDERVVARLLAALLGVVVVDEQLDRAVGAGGGVLSLNASLAYWNARSMNSSPRIRYHSLRRRPSANSPLSPTTSLTTSNATSGLLAPPNWP